MCSTRGKHNSQNSFPRHLSFGLFRLDQRIDFETSASRRCNGALSASVPNRMWLIDPVVRMSYDQGFHIESKKFPLLQVKASNGLYYSQDEVREIVRYACDRGILQRKSMSTNAGRS